jgi:hypothetical protein
MRYRSSVGVSAAGTIGFILCSFSMQFEIGAPHLVSSRFVVSDNTAPRDMAGLLGSHPVLLARNFGRSVLLGLEFVRFSRHPFSDCSGLCAAAAA